MNKSDAEYEYIVVGSGAGGGTVAARLAEAGRSVLLLEAGGDPKGPNMAGGVEWNHHRRSLPDDYDVPVFHAISTESDAMRWDFWVRHYTDPEQQARDPKYYETYPRNGGESVDGVLYPRAGTLGGCTAHNAMILVYPHNSDWDELAELVDDPSWRAANMRKYFERMENCHHRGPWRFIYKIFGWSPTRHGFGGWLSSEKALPKSALGDRKLVDAVLGSVRVALTTVARPWHRIVWLIQGVGDPNDWRLVRKNAVGLRYPPLTTRKHSRRGTREFLLDVAKRHRGKLTIELNALVTRVIFDDKNRAIGVEYQKGERLYQAHYQPSDQAGETKSTYASREVILAGGAFNTPQLLMLSGIGPRQELERHGIEVRVDLPGVGQNLQDRYEVGVVSRMKENWQVLDGARFERGDPQFEQWNRTHFWQRRRGVYTTNGAIVAVIKKSDVVKNADDAKSAGEPKSPPDLFCFALLGKFRGYEPKYSKAAVDHHNYLTWAVLKAHTNNRGGTVTLASNDPRHRPVINFHYFEEGTDQHQQDLEAVVDGVEFARKAIKGIEDLVEEEEAPTRAMTTRAQLRQFVKDNAWGHHASCTCPIGPDPNGDDLKAVLDNNFRVYGTQGLRVVDASVFPRIPGFFIVSSVYMIAEKAADVILADTGYPLPLRGVKKWAQKIKSWLGRIWKWGWRLVALLIVLLALVIGASWLIFEPPPENPDRAEEAKTIKNIVSLLSGKLTDQYENAPQFLRDTHPKANACVRADFTVEETLPPELRLGVFRGKPDGDRTYTSWIRFSNAADVVTPDTVEDFRGMAIKLFDVEGEKLPVPSPESDLGPDDDDEKRTQDFFFIAHDAFFAGSPQHFHDFFAAAVEGGSASPDNLPVIWHLLTHPRGAWNSLQGRRVYPSIENIRWFSVAPFKLGNQQIVKYSALPCESVQFHPPTADTTSDDYLKVRLRDRLNPSWNGDGICLSFNVQVRANDDQPIENTLVAWDVDESPWQRVATIRIPPQEFTSPEQAEFCQNITFNPWHSLPVHEPVGGINRARRDVMFALQKVRLEANGRQRFEPTGNEYFFPGAKFPWREPPPGQDGG